jgi:hypothetical protein
VVFVAAGQLPAFLAEGEVGGADAADAAGEVLGLWEVGVEELLWEVGGGGAEGF